MRLKALWSATAVAAIYAMAMLTLLTWPPYKSGSWELASPPSWWQLEGLAAIGIALSALPSLALFHLDWLFASADRLRNPFAGLLITFEVLLLCLVTYRIVIALDGRRHKNKQLRIGFGISN